MYILHYIYMQHIMYIHPIGLVFPIRNEDMNFCQQSFGRKTLQSAPKNPLIRRREITPLISG